MNLQPTNRQQLLRIARTCIENRTRECPDQAIADELRTVASSFVTLRKNGGLRGCIGALEATQPLYLDVAEHAYNAAYHDNRFHPVQMDEVAQLHIHISVLGDTKAMACRDERDLLDQLRVGVDGLILQYRHHRATFLPSVWRELSNKQEFVGHLKAKAGLARDFWDSDMVCRRYTVLEFEE